METKEFQRWTAKRKAELLLRLIWGEKKPVDAYRQTPGRVVRSVARGRSPH